MLLYIMLHFIGKTRTNQLTNNMNKQSRQKDRQRYTNKKLLIFLHKSLLQQQKTKKKENKKKKERNLFFLFLNDTTSPAIVTTTNTHLKRHLQHIQQCCHHHHYDLVEALRFRFCFYLMVKYSDQRIKQQTQHFSVVLCSVGVCAALCALYDLRLSQS